MKKKVSTKVWVIAIVLVFVLCAAFTAYVYWRGQQTRDTDEIVGPIAVVYQNGVLVGAVDLGTVGENYTMTFTGEDGAENVVEFAHGQVRMQSSTCPDQVCVGMGWQDGSFPLPIACLPNSVIVQFVSVDETQGSDVDGAAK